MAEMYFGQELDLTHEIIFQLALKFGWQVKEA